MKKVLLIQGRIPHYRVDVFNELSERVDLTVIYSEGNLPDNVKFKTLCIPTRNFHYKFHKKRLYFIAQKYDAVICMLDYSYIDFRLLNILPRKYKLIFWGIGVSASYDCRYDSAGEDYTKRIVKILNRADAAVFYSDYPKKKYVKYGIKEEKMYVANNTVRVLPVTEQERDIIMFIGSLYKQKKIDVLFEHYLNAYKKNNDIPDMVVIGDGDEKDNLLKFIDDNNLNGKIILTGGIYDETELSKYFSRALLCISPDQAGLSVLKSMGYGVPFVTHKDSITGGEIFNIENKLNGFLVDDFSEIEDLIVDCGKNRDLYLQMGKNAKSHYDNNRTIEKMADGFTEAIDYVLNK